MIGCHISKHKKLSIGDSLLYFCDIFKKQNFTLKCASIFISNPMSHNYLLKQDDQENLKQTIKKLDISIIAHGSYCDVPWNNSENLKFVVEELKICEYVGIKGLVIHLSKKPLDEIIPSLISINKLFQGNTTKLYLETPAINTNNPENIHYASIEQIKTLVEKLGKISDLFGVCIDTAHIHISGIDLSTYEKADVYFKEIEKIIKNGNVSDLFVLHLNDSTQELGKGKDNHEALMKGKIWKGYKYKDSGLKAIFEFIKRNNIITILERKDGLLGDFELINENF